MNIGHRLKAYRLRHRLTQAALAAMAQKYMPDGKRLSQERISQIECGLTGVSLVTLKALAMALGIGAADLDHELMGVTGE